MLGRLFESFILKLPGATDWPATAAQCMSTPPDQDLERQDLLSRFQSLTININVVASPSTSTSLLAGTSRTSSTAAPNVRPQAPSTSSSPTTSTSPAWLHQPTPLESPACVRHLAQQLRSPLSGKSPEERIEMAYLRDREGAQIAWGES